ncbi:sperm surface protein Sp17-like isoform X2 [Ptychodera flava]|uniref:sperm surface protein Sp17-like isoform X2 n=1 Tax=Ptychodera flava TaxID=63121 RepID=UPI00396A1475
MATRRPPTKYAVPDGFETLLEGLAKEVLRSQPENIYQFASDYFDSLLRMRESTQTDKLETLVSLYDPSRRSQPCERTIQSATSSYQSEVTYHSEVEVTTDDEGNDLQDSLTNGSIRQQDDADPVTATGGHVTSINGENEAASKIQAGYRGYKTRKCVEKKRINEGRAAVKIQAGYRGHKTRRAITEKRREEKMAAVTIQSNYRGYRERKQHSTGQPDQRR